MSSTTNLLAINGKVIGGLPIASENLRLLWENPDPTASFAAQTINLSASDYDLLLVIYRTRNTNEYTCSHVIEKGEDAFLNYSSYSPNGVFSAARTFLYESDTSYSADNASYSVGSAASIQDNGRIIPSAIYGIYKKSIANTEASKCMLSDGVTSVESALITTKNYTATAASGYSFAVNRIDERAGWCSVALVINPVTLASGNTWIKVATSPLKPVVDMTSVVFNASTVRVTGESRIDTDGNIYVCLADSVSGAYLSMFFSFIINYS